jgi:hypothetical protein
MNAAQEFFEKEANTVCDRIQKDNLPNIIISIDVDTVEGIEACLKIISDRHPNVIVMLLGYADNTTVVLGSYVPPDCALSPEFLQQAVLNTKVASLHTWSSSTTTCCVGMIEYLKIHARDYMQKVAHIALDMIQKM